MSEPTVNEQCEDCKERHCPGGIYAGCDGERGGCCACIETDDRNWRAYFGITTSWNPSSRFMVMNDAECAAEMEAARRFK